MDTLINILPAPINSFSWAVGGIVILLYGIRGWSAWKRSHNQFSKYFALMGMISGIGLFIYGAAALFDLSTQAIFATMIVGFVLVNAGLYIHSLFTAAYIKSIILRRLFQAIIIISGVAALVFMAVNGYIEETPTLTRFVMPVKATYLQGLFLALTLFPAGFIFFKKVHSYDDRRLKLRSIIISFTYLTMGGIAIASYIINQNRDTEIGAIVNLVLFTIFGLVILVLTRRKQQEAPPA